MKNVLVTGGAGFIGSHIVDRLVEEGFHVYVIDDMSSGFVSNVNPKAELIQMSILDNEVESLFRRVKFHFVNHHAGQISVRDSVIDPVSDSNLNVIGTLRLLEQCRKHSVPKFIFASTGGALYGEQDYFPADENHKTEPVSPYGVSKLSAENYINYYARCSDLNAVILRYSNVYGPRQNAFGEAGVIAKFCSKMINGETPIINGDGKQTRDFLFVNDVVEANVRATTLSGSHTLNIGTGVETNINELFQILNRQFDDRFERVNGDALDGEQRRSCLDSELSNKRMNWQYQTDVQNGLVKTLEWFKQNRLNA